jgi:hypothetical protein
LLRFYADDGSVNIDAAMFVLRIQGIRQRNGIGNQRKTAIDDNKGHIIECAADIYLLAGFAMQFA